MPHTGRWLQLAFPHIAALPILKRLCRPLWPRHTRMSRFSLARNPHPDPAVARSITEYCREMTISDRRVSFQAHPQDLGPPANFNSIAEAARGEYLVLIGDDDRLLPTFVERLMSEVDSETTLAFCNRHIIDAAGLRLNSESLAQTHYYARDRISPGKLADPEVWAWQQSAHTESSLIRTRLFRETRFREDLDMPDVELFIILARRYGNFVFTAQYLSEYRLHQDSTTGRGFRDYAQLVDLLAKMEVSAEVAPYKRRLLQSLTFATAKRALAQGDRFHARQRLRSEYRPKGIRAKAMSLCAALPGRMGSFTYDHLSRLADTFVANAPTKTAAYPGRNEI